MPKKTPKKSKPKAAVAKPAKVRPKPARAVFDTETKAFAPSQVSSAWHKSFQLLLAFRRRNPAKWPSRDSKNNMEVRMANWIRSNLELLTAGRLPSEQARMIGELLSGTYGQAKARK